MLVVGTMSAHVVGVVRSTSRLETLVYEASDPPSPEQPWMRAESYELRPVVPGSRPALWAAWRALESVTRWDETTLAHVLAVLRETVPGADTPSDLPALGAEVNGPPEPRATAAHPRAFRGTKYRPPRPRQPDAVDLRPYLMTRRHTDQVLELLGEPRGIDPYVAWNHRADASASFDPSFVMFLLPLLRGCTWSEVGAFASLARALELHGQPELRAALVGVYLAAGDAGRALGWWSHVLAHDADQRLEIARLVSASGVARHPAVAAEFAAEVARLPAIQQWSVVRGLAAGASPDYLSSGMELGALSPSKFDEVPPGRVAVASIVESTVERLDKAMDEDSGSDFWRGHLWRLCGHQPELIDLMGSAGFASLSSEAAFWLLRTASSLHWYPETVNARWRALAPKLAMLVELATRLPREYQRKFIEDICDVYGWAIHDSRDGADALARCVDLCLRVAKAPFATESSLGATLSAMALLYADGGHDPDRRAIRDAPESSWLALENACQRENQSHLLARGLHRLARFAPTLIASTFPTNPGALLQTADAVAAVSSEQAERLLKQYLASPLADPSLADAPLDRLCRLVDPIVKAGGPNPIRRALRRHLSGEKALTDAQLRGHRARIVADLGILRLAAIRQSIERALAARVGLESIETSTVRHALAMLTHVDMHRRQLRRMLAATIAGDRDWRLRHPRTKQWFARHPRLDRDAWLAGIAVCGELPGIGPVRVAIEPDPLEALKLGSYVGTCLGRGGGLEYSAAAVVLDVNKHVIYARDTQGSVIGRQLIVLSEAEELVCFGVYGSARTAVMEPLFRQFDVAFAAKLGVRLFNRRSPDYEVASILSHEWWNDIALEDLQIEPVTAAAPPTCGR